jgi:hypothetical protein
VREQVLEQEPEQAQNLEQVREQEPPQAPVFPLHRLCYTPTPQPAPA